MPTTRKLRALGEAAPELKELVREFHNLRDRIEAVGESYAERGRGRLSAVRKDTDDRMEDILREFRQLERQATRAVRNHPFQSAAVVLGIGVLLAFLFRR